MKTYQEAVELAHMCARNAHIASTAPVAGELWRMAVQYQKQAAALDSGKLPDIGPPPPLADRG